MPYMDLNMDLMGNTEAISWRKKNKMIENLYSKYTLLNLL